jgi:polyhydroxyalkanoate synthesis regulator phasin
MQEEGVMDISESLRVVADNAERLGMGFSAHEVREAAAEIDILRARVRELEAALARHGRQGEAAIETVVAMDAEASHG